ncbi:MAG: 23S rRNA (uracil-5-)-methyltransferase RumA, partial [Bacteroides sp.]
TGCDEKVIAAIIKISPKRVVYVSCNPATLARDAAKLAQAGYELQEAHPFDMFPETGHVETVCLLSKFHSDHHI